MKYKFLLSIISIFFVQIINAQKLQNTIFEKEFNWSLNIPEDFEKATVTQEERELGKKAIEKATNAKFEKNSSIKMFAYKYDKMNYFDASYQTLHSSIIENYDNEVRNMNRMLYKTLSDSYPSAKIDSTFTTEKIDNLIFTKLHLKINEKVNLVVYKRLFDNKDLTFNILYNNIEKGDEIIKQFRESKFK